MNGKITVIRRQERVGHRLRADLRTPGLVRPGASVETRRSAHRYRGFKRAPGNRREFGWYRGRNGLSSQSGTRGFFIFLDPIKIPHRQLHPCKGVFI